MMLVFELNISSSLMTLESGPGDCADAGHLLQTVTDPSSSYQRCCYPAETSNNTDFVIIYHQARTGHNLRNSKKIVPYIIQSKLKGQSWHYYYYSILYHLTWSVSTCMSDSLHSL